MEWEKPFTYVIKFKRKENNWYRRTRQTKTNKPNKHNTHKQSQKPKYKIETNTATYIMEKGLIP